MNQIDELNVATRERTLRNLEGKPVAWMILDRIKLQPCSVTLDKDLADAYNPEHVVELVTKPQSSAKSLAALEVENERLKQSLAIAYDAVAPMEWVAASDLPDSDTIVLVFNPAEIEPIWLGYYDGAAWYYTDGSPAAPTFWADMPGGPTA